VSAEQTSIQHKLLCKTIYESKSIFSLGVFYR